jgi:hypothetical protein
VQPFEFGKLAVEVIWSGLLLCPRVSKLNDNLASLINLNTRYVKAGGNGAFHRPGDIALFEDAGSAGHRRLRVSNACLGSWTAAPGNGTAETRAATRNRRTAGLAQLRSATASYELASLSKKSGAWRRIAPRSPALISRCFPTDRCRALYLAIAGWM